MASKKPQSKSKTVADTLKELKINKADLGWAEFDIEFVENMPHDDKGTKEFGECDTDLCHIKVCLSQKPQGVRETLFHEILHGVLETVGFGDREEDGEDKVTASNEELTLRIARGMILFCNLNPELARVVLGLEDE